MFGCSRRPGEPLPAPVQSGQEPVVRAVEELRAALRDILDGLSSSAAAPVVNGPAPKPVAAQPLFRDFVRASLDLRLPAEEDSYVGKRTG